MLQIEMFGWHVDRLSRSVTSGPDFAEELLQIETLGSEVFFNLDL